MSSVTSTLTKTKKKKLKLLKNNGLTFFCHFRNISCFMLLIRHNINKHKLILIITLGTFLYMYIFFVFILSFPCHLLQDLDWMTSNNVQVQGTRLYQQEGLIFDEYLQLIYLNLMMEPVHLNLMNDQFLILY